LTSEPLFGRAWKIWAPRWIFPQTLRTGKMPFRVRISAFSFWHFVIVIVIEDEKNSCRCRAKTVCPGEYHDNSLYGVFNAGSEAEFDKVPKGRLKARRSCVRSHFHCGLARSAVPLGLVVVSHRNPALKRAIFTWSLPGPTSGALIDDESSRILREFGEIRCGTGQKLSPKCQDLR
jgi:hypothetical protein